MVQRFFAEQRVRIRRVLRDTLRSRGDIFHPVQPWGPDVRRRLGRFVESGKMLRGGLVVLGHELAGGRPTSDTYRIAAAVEFIHSGLLIHDDIIDRDTLRRGAPTIAAQYRSLGRRLRVSDGLHFGASMGICTGDVALFLGFQVLGTPHLTPRIHREVIQRSANELARVALAQMLDVHLSERTHATSERDILTLYRNKTAGYTFVLPLTLGALLGNARPLFLRKLEQLGGTLGLMFQIRDDTIGLFGTRREIGKPVGSDIRENKQTLFAVSLFQRVTGRERRTLAGIFGNDRLTAAMVRTVRQSIEHHHVRDDVERLMDRFERTARTQIRALRIPSAPRALLEGLVRYSRDRVH